MPDGLYALVYTSRAARPLTDRDLDALLDRSRAHNRQHGLTGFLSYDRDADDPDDPGTFVQRLEGPRAAVLDVFRWRVAPSVLHDDVRVTMEGPVRRRAFAGWSMAFARAAPDGLDAHF